MEIVKQVGGFAVKVEPGLGQLNAARVTHKQHHVQPGFHPLDGVTDGRGGDPQLGSRLAEAAEACGGGEGQQVLFGKDGIHITASSVISFEHILTTPLQHI